MFRNLAEQNKEAKARSKASLLLLTFLAVSTANASEAPSAPQIAVPDVVARSVEPVSKDPLILLQEFGVRANLIAPESAELEMVLEQTSASAASPATGGFHYPTYE